MSTRISPCEMTAKYAPALERLRRYTVRSLLVVVNVNEFVVAHDRNALNVWLKECAQKYIDTDTSWHESSLEESIGMSKVMAALCANNLPKACKHAKDLGDLKLALLMSQSQVCSPTSLLIFTIAMPQARMHFHRLRCSQKMTAVLCFRCPV